MTDGGASEDPKPKSADEVLDRATELERAQGERGAAREKIDVQKARVDLNLQKVVGYGALIVMIVQLVLADAVFVLYAVHKGWGDLPTGAIQAWLAATVIQVVGVVLIIARCVFPLGGRRSE
ncbi:MAG: hypothetical protein QOG15_1630 [Solirubrobacteraceae bacterium]|nr:hypothetical protein [Solirubrobacteraceae bacterium]